MIRFSALFYQYKEPFILFANSYIRNRTVAEDIYMEAFEAYWSKHNDLPADTNIPAYILTSIKNGALAYLRRRQMMANVHEETYEHQFAEQEFRISSLEDCSLSALFTGEIERIIHETLEEFPEQTRVIFFKSRMEGKRNSETAQEMGLSVKAVEYHLTKVLKILHLRLKDYLMILLVFLMDESAHMK